MGFDFASVGFVALNLALSLLTVLVWRIVRSRRLDSRSLFALRMLPAIGSAGLVLGLVLPAYVSFEPRETTESSGPALGVFVLIGLALVAAGIRRTISSWRETRRVERRWLDAAIGRASLGIPVRAFHVSTTQPLAALVGVVRPRLFVSDRFLNALTAGEQQAVIEHEAGHLRSLDNLKRTAMRLAPDWLNLWSTGREIETAWAAAAEAEADDHAAGPDRSRSLDLASALLKASRLAPMRLATVSNFCDESTIASRVARLLEDAPVHRDKARAWVPRIACALALVGAAAVAVTPTLRAAYQMTEAVIRLVQ
jgi:beta-lactamase regulating signal transducer with metallopeptidase domain